MGYPFLKTCAAATADVVATKWIEYPDDFIDFTGHLDTNRTRRRANDDELGPSAAIELARSSRIT